jgi:hypothetical protein
LKKNILLSVCLVLASLGSGSAQQSNTAKTHHSDDADIRLLREDIRAERKKIVAANLPLTSAEATRFWPVYDQYVSEMSKVNDARYGLIKDYAQSYHAMTDAQAGDLIKRSVSLDSEGSQVRMKYIPEVEKVISPKKAAIFFQIDRRLDMLLNLQIASEVPLVMP